MNSIDNDRPYKVYKITNGTVIDHIPGGNALKVIEILGMPKGGIVSIGMNFDSTKLGKKDIIKIENKYLTQDEANKIALIAPTATVNIIRNSERVDKIKLNIPEILENILRCHNPKCVTNNEEVDTKFYIDSKNPLKIRCHYCERCMRSEDITLK